MDSLEQAFNELGQKTAGPDASREKKRRLMLRLPALRAGRTPTPAAGRSLASP